MTKRNLYIKLAFTLSVLSSQPVIAGGLLSDAWGILTDPLKLGKSTENMIHAVERSAILAERLEGKINEDVKARLEQIDRTVRETREQLDKTVRVAGEKIDQITTKSLNRISQIQKDVFVDTAELIKCSTEVSLTQIQTKLAESLNDLGKRKPRFEIFGIPLFSAEIDPLDINSPIGSFREVKKLYDLELASISSDQHPSKITDIYGEMQRIADLTRCHYKNDNALAIELYAYELEYNRLGRYWIGKVEPI